MTEHIQLELIAALVLIAGQVITAWRADIAARRADVASKQAEKAVTTAVTLGKEQAAAVGLVHDAVNGGMAAQKKEIVDLKAEVVRLNEVIAGTK